jgi:Reverse transcriptase (RNA-dependent DNA polymerase)
VFLNSLSQTKEPNFFEIVKLDPKWCKTMDEELHTLEKNKIWKICFLLKIKKSVGCKWMYKIKYHSDGIIEWYKTKLVVKGYNQIYDIDYHEIFASIAKNKHHKKFVINCGKQWLKTSPNYCKECFSSNNT